MSTVQQLRFSEERALFGARQMRINDCVFGDGESPLKHCDGVEIESSIFEWKYPLWYARDIKLERSLLLETARSGIWYTRGITVRDTVIQAPKTFRRSSGIALERVHLPHADETLWACTDVELAEVSATGDYFAMNSARIAARDLNLSGNYAFDGASDVEVSGSRIISKDAFWNSRDVTVRDSLIVGEYLGWNSQNLTFENCTIVSLQGMCYIDDLTLRNCKLIDTTLAFEYSAVDAEVTTRIDSVLNPRSGVIRAPEIGELTMEPDRIDPAATAIEAAVISARGGGSGHEGGGDGR